MENSDDVKQRIGDDVVKDRGDDGKEGEGECQWKVNVVTEDNKEIMPFPEEYNERVKEVFVMFVNPISGNQEGKVFLQIGEKFNKSVPHYKIIDYSKIQPPIGVTYEGMLIFMYNLIDKNEYTQCVNTIKHFIPHACINNIPLKVLIAGGDGTVLSIVQDLNNSNINISSLIFGHIPLGTGNDLSNSLGFSNHISISPNTHSLYTILLKYSKAINGKVDVWKMDLSLDVSFGDILEIKNKTKSSKPDIITENDTKIYSRIFINYLSLGYDARVGYNFDKNRTDSRSHNKCIYFWEGLKKNFCRRTAPVSSFLESFSVLEDENESINEGTFLSHNLTNRENPQQQEPKVKFCFKPKKSLSDIEKNMKCIIMKGEPASIICQNINMYMAGVEDIWKESKVRTNLEVINTEHKKEYKNKFKEMSSGEQKMDDHQLEFFTYSNGLVTGMERMIRGLADKLYHGRGPVVMKFKQLDTADNNDRFNRIYLNVDGEYFQLVKPLQMRIQLARELCGGSIPFLKCEKGKV